jgi:hypothetical protein
MKAGVTHHPGRARSVGLALALALASGVFPLGSRAAEEPNHQAPWLESTLPRDLPGIDGDTRSFVGEIAACE